METAFDIDSLTMNADHQSLLGVKLEDLHTTNASSPSLDSDAQSQNPVHYVKSKPAKKRKSWGQTLPEPKTTLPPRKRAKTDDEKEQRRIERIKRNRAAAHNSRERKRQETDTLAVALAKAEAQLAAYRQLHGPLPSSVILPDIRLIDDYEDEPTPSRSGSNATADVSYGTTGAAYSPSESPDDDDIFENGPVVKQEPSDITFTTPLPPVFENLDAKPLPLSPLDPTQHPAAMLCDLQCRSSSQANNGINTTRSNPNNTTQTPTPSPTSASLNPWAQLILHLFNIQLQICYKTLLLAIWSLSPLRMARMMQASALRLTSRSTTSSSTTTQLVRSTALAQRSIAATRRLTEQGALVALQRSDRRSSVDGELVARRRESMLRRRKRRSFHEDVDQNGGV